MPIVDATPYSRSRRMPALLLWVPAGVTLAAAVFVAVSYFLPIRVGADLTPRGFYAGPGVNTYLGFYRPPRLGLHAEQSDASYIGRATRLSINLGGPLSYEIAWR